MLFSFFFFCFLFFCFCFQSLHAFLLFLRFFAISFHFAFAKHLCECKLQKLQHSKPRAELENLRVHFGTRHFPPKLYTNVKNYLISHHKKKKKYIYISIVNLFLKEMQINYCIVLYCKPDTLHRLNAGPNC